jgi:hypothetical protein
VKSPTPASRIITAWMLLRHRLVKGTVLAARESPRAGTAVNPHGRAPTVLLIVGEVIATTA